MPRLSLNMDEELHQRLLIYAIKTTGKAHGVKEQIILDAIKSYLDTNEGAAPAVECVVSSGEVPVTAKPVKKTTRKSPITEDDQLKIKEAWEARDTGQRNISEVARQFPEYTDRQVRHFIEKNLKS